MRDYGKVHTSIWTSANMRAMSEDGRALAMYLLTCPHGTIAGVFRIPDGYACEDLQWSSERVQKGFRELFHNGFANRCETSKWVWIYKHFDWNLPENPNQRKSAAKIAGQIPDECEWKQDYIRVCGHFIGVQSGEKSNPSETLPEPFRNQEQEQEQEQEKEKEPREPDGIAPPSGDSESESEGQPRKGKKVTFKVFCDACKARGETLLTDYEALWDYAESVGIETEWIEVAWWRFKARYLHDANSAQKRYIDWRQVFLNACKSNWFKLWALPSGSDAAPLLTSDGRLAIAEYRAVTQKAAA